MKYKKALKSSALGLLWLTFSVIGISSAFAQAAKETNPSDPPQIDEIEPEDPFLTTEEDVASPAPSLFEVTNTVSGLLEPLDLATETQRALRGAGRTDPFKPANQSTTTLPDLPDFGASSASLPPLPNTDSAQFAKSVRVTGIVRVGNENFALLESPNTVADVIPEGGFYETVQVASISVNTGEVVLQEGGQTIVAFVE